MCPHLRLCSLALRLAPTKAVSNMMDWPMFQSQAGCQTAMGRGLGGGGGSVAPARRRQVAAALARDRKEGSSKEIDQNTWLTLEGEQISK